MSKRENVGLVYPVSPPSHTSLQTLSYPTSQPWGLAIPLPLSPHHEETGELPSVEVPSYFSSLGQLPLTLSRLIEVSSRPKGCSNHPHLLLPAPRDPTQGHWGEPVPDAAACHHHQRHGQRPPPEHFLSQLQWPCRGQQAAGPSSSGCWGRREPLCW